jgi:uncharacterized protein
MWLMFGAILSASLLGSMHCVGMCGAFLAMATIPEPGRASAPSGARLQAAYHGGRLVTYVTLGSLAGLLGQTLDLGGQFVGVPRVAAILAGAVMVLFAGSNLLRLWGVSLPRVRLPGAWLRLVTLGHERAMDLAPTGRAIAIGLLTTLLPCGWLYAFVAFAAGTASAGTGALAMVAFWLGTLPVMVSLGIGLTRFGGPLRRHMPVATSLLLLVVGLAAVGGRLSIDLPVVVATAGTPASLTPICHDPRDLALMAEDTAPEVAPSAMSESSSEPAPAPDADPDSEQVMESKP